DWRRARRKAGRPLPRSPWAARRLWSPPAEQGRRSVTDQAVAEQANTRRYVISVVPGDGIGKEAVPEGLRVLEAVGRKVGISFEWQEKDWSCDTYARTGRMMPEDGFDQLGRTEAIFLGAVGWPTVPDHVS